MTIPPELRQCTWVAIPNEDAAELSDQFGLRIRFGSLRQALARADGRQVLAVRDGHLFLFGAGLDPVGLSKTWGEVFGFSIDTAADTYRCVRCRRGEVVRRIERIGGGPVGSEGRPGQKREPSLDTVDGETVLAVAAAWYCDPVPALPGVGWVLEPYRERSRERSRVRVDLHRPPVRVPVRVWVVFGLVVLTFLLSVFVAERRPADARGSERADAVCRAEPTCDACSTCAMTTEAHRCAPRVRDCAADPACSALWRCLDGCGAEKRARFAAFDGTVPGASLTFDFACEERCGETHADGVARYLDWYRCVGCDACADTCDWQTGRLVPMPEWLSCPVR